MTAVEQGILVSQVTVVTFGHGLGLGEVLRDTGEEEAAVQGMRILLLHHLHRGKVNHSPMISNKTAAKGGT